MKLNEIRTFVTVAQTGSVQAAARQLHMTQSVVSRLVQRLERDLGATLFDRQSKPLALTYDGQSALHHGRRVHPPTMRPLMQNRQKRTPSNYDGLSIARRA
ncbi:LysR family transcriptional regulator [Bradyrhizobium sp. AS23.2]|uniref:LysR family transcriptional regulator n=1 Tax=Bradyrhizobium sp. AS23.2 TaxID=1680155 RepID=UPI00093A820B|nr:LysR family transcriptional regulator [Bradyrhizobium sp. AS23.2]